MFIISTTYQVELSTIESLLPAHLEWLKRQYDAGIFIASGRKTPWTGSVILARGCTRAELDDILAKDPFAVSAAATSEVTELGIARTAPGLEGLIES